MDNLLNYIHQVATGEYICKPYQIKGYTKTIRKSIDELTNKIKMIFPELPNARWVAIRLLEGDQTIIDSVRTGEIGQLISVPSSNMSEVI